LLQQDFSPLALNYCWAGYITYIRSTAGWRHLAVSYRSVRHAETIDLQSPRLVGWAMAETMTTTQVLEDVNQSLGHYQALIKLGRKSLRQSPDQQD
jgi:transposase InsO family protein